MSKQNEIVRKLEEAKKLAEQDSRLLNRESQDAVFYALEDAKLRVKEAYARS